MKSYAAVITVLSTLFAIGAAQVFLNGTCTKTQEVTYVLQNLSPACARALGQVDFETPSTPNPDFRNRSEALKTVCTPECGGTLADWLNKSCNDFVGYTGLTLWCTPRESSAQPGNDWCYFALPPTYDSTMFDALVVCANNTLSNPCPAGCADALRSIVDGATPGSGLGCCYQSLYNNTEFLLKVVEARFATPMEHALVQEVRDRSLWDACGVVPPEECDQSLIVSTGGGVTKTPLNFSVMILVASLLYLLTF